MQWVTDEIKAIQSTGIDWYGAPLKVDGVVGPKTLWWIGILSLDPKRQAVIRLALKYHHEKMGEVHGNSIANDGTFVDMLLSPSKLKNQPWCIAFASHVYQTCAVEWPIYHISTYKAIEWAKRLGLLVSEPLPGDLELFLYPKQPDKDWQGHGRIVLAFDRASKQTYGVDGNVGDRVSTGRRRDRQNRIFVRPKGLTANSKGLTFPSGTTYIDNIGDR